MVIDVVTADSEVARYRMCMTAVAQRARDCSGRRENQDDQSEDDEHDGLPAMA
ncbi:MULTISPECIES: hypothetical protein [Rhodococcus]|uniref:hypothetical protein n=1 Tax=Rhodococcus TaxID=1827 RepID=UPI0012D368F6|nr:MULTISPECIES: hypothetical protein [Rhodococcus]MCE4265528.1 hypothetical protein [Rhodococcus globerulus]MDV8069039.1 hypothetical protein [Rhodococcus sp. IEGM 1366]NMD59973.1 hypothetical protein [Nocardia globerula]QXW04752.1 hypothetical protein KYT97_12445 [Rhodococcus globerulus]